MAKINYIWINLIYQFTKLTAEKKSYKLQSPRPHAVNN